MVTSSFVLRRSALEPKCTATTKASELVLFVDSAP
jgi:hypothetical protein